MTKSYADAIKTKKKKWLQKLLKTKINQDYLQVCFLKHL